MKPIKLLLMTFIFLFMVGLDTSLAREYEYAGSYAIPHHQSGFTSEQYEKKTIKKLGRGVQNFLLGWLEVPQGVKSEIGYREQEYLPVGIETFFVGTFKGIGRTARRMGVGLYEVFTFPYAQGPIIQEMEEWWY